MKVISLSIAVLGVWIAAGSAQAADKTVTLHVENMTCASCPYIVKRSLSAVPGVKSAEVSYENQSATITYDDAVTSPEVLTRTTAEAGYPSQVKS